MDLVDLIETLNVYQNFCVSGDSAHGGVIIRMLKYVFSGALGQAFTSDRFGRKGSILIWSIIFTIGVAVQTGTVRSVPQITIGYYIMFILLHTWY